MSPVIGSILILVITIFAMAGVLAWGVPAIQGLQEHAEFQSVQTQLLELNQELRNLRDPQNTRVATLSIADGSLRFTKGDRWVITAMAESTYAAYKVTSYQDDDTTVTLTGIPVSGTATAEAVVGGKFTVRDTESCVAATPCSLTLAAGDLANNVTRIQFKEATIVKAESWILDVGRFTYTQPGERNYNHLEMGASLIQQGDRAYMRQSPTVKEPMLSATPADNDFFIRTLQLVGNQAVGGRGEFSVLVNLVDNYGVSRGRPLFDPAALVRFQLDGDLEEAFCNHFLQADDDYSYDGTSADCAGGDADVLYNPGTTFTFEMSQAVVNGYVRSA